MDILAKMEYNIVSMVSLVYNHLISHVKFAALSAMLFYSCPEDVNQTLALESGLLRFRVGHRS